MARTRHRDRAEAFNIGAAGDNAPDWVLADPALLAAFDQGQADGAQGPAFHPPVDRAPAKPRPTPKPSPASSSGAPATGQRTAAGSSGLLGISAGDASGANKAKRAIGTGDGSGVLLGVLAYPLLLALAKGGPAEVLAWLKAKFLNRVPAAPGEIGGNAGPLGGVGPLIPGTQIPVTPTPQPGGKTGPFQPTPAR